MNETPDHPSNSPEIPGNIPPAVVGRLCLYLRELQQLARLNKETISSRSLGKNLGISDTQVRKDFAYFGQLGMPGVGYRCQDLIVKIKQILGTDRRWPVGLVGCGNLGQALLGYQGFQSQGLQVVAAFDSAPEVIGQTMAGLRILPMSEFRQTVRTLKIQLAMLAVPALAAKSVADELVAAGIVGILNFAPVTLIVPPRISVVEVDLAIELEQLVYRAAQRSKRKPGQP
jgi:redox-sensing transcriptional repressor